MFISSSVLIGLAVSEQVCDGEREIEWTLRAGTGEAGQAACIRCAVGAVPADAHRDAAAAAAAEEWLVPGLAVRTDGVSGFPHLTSVSLVPPQDTVVGPMPLLCVRAGRGRLCVTIANLGQHRGSRAQEERPPSSERRPPVVVLDAALTGRTAGVKCRLALWVWAGCELEVVPLAAAAVGGGDGSTSGGGVGGGRYVLRAPLSSRHATLAVRLCLARVSPRGGTQRYSDDESAIAPTLTDTQTGLTVVGATPCLRYLGRTTSITE